MTPAPVTIEPGPGICIRAALEVAAATGAPVLLTPAAVTDLVHEHRRLIEKANDQVRQEWAGTMGVQR